jgi:hypothetical protein
VVAGSSPVAPVSHHLFGVVPDAAWRIIDDSGLERVDVDGPRCRRARGVRWAAFPPAENFRRQIEAG